MSDPKTARTLLSEEEKALRKAFRDWMAHPTHPSVLERLANLMVNHELGVRMRMAMPYTPRSREHQGETT